VNEIRQAAEEEDEGQNEEATVGSGECRVGGGGSSGSGDILFPRRDDFCSPISLSPLTDRAGANAPE
jgi:hypothetical protein